ncbi:MAG TPA: S53 family peptidase [Bryobacteraceae bacterium]
MAFEKKVPLPGSEQRPVPALQEVGPVPTGEEIEVSVVIRRKGGRPVQEPGAVLPRVSYARFAEEYGADPADIALVENFARQAGLTVVESSVAKRRVILRGLVHAIARTFGAEQFARYCTKPGGPVFRARSGTLSVPAELAGVVIAVLGLDTRPVARAHFRIRPHQAPAVSYSPPEVAALYAFPTGATGAGQTIAIIELGGGYSASDLKTYFGQLGITEPSVTAVSVDGGQNSPGSDADGEVMLDIEVAGSIAPAAKIAVYFAPNTDQGFVDAISDAVHDAARKPSVVSISWGAPEDSWTEQSRTAMNAALQDAAALGVTVTAAAGDNGSTDGAGDGKLHVDFPASSPYALACGGTTLKGSGSTVSSETVWNETASGEGATGGGISTAFPLPSYQNAAQVPAQPQTNFAGRGVPDISGNADPATGYNVLVNGQNIVVGGTSAVAPLWAALVALLNQQTGSSLGFLQPKLYALAASNFRDITEGSNDDSGLGYYKAGSGWDPCTGLGSPNGTALLDALNTNPAGA